MAHWHDFNLQLQLLDYTVQVFQQFAGKLNSKQGKMPKESAVWAGLLSF